MESKQIFDYSHITEKDYLPNPPQSFSSRAIHVGQQPEAKFGCVNVPIYLSTTYAQNAPGQPYGEYDYTRCGNPTRTAFETCIASLENGKHGIAFSSGCAALTAVIHLFKSGDNIVCCDDVYGGTQRYLRRFSEEKHGYTVTFVDMTDLDKVTQAITEQTKLIWIETPTNPMLKLIDIEAVVKIARAQSHKILVSVDNTFATSYLQNPLDLGADIVSHSCTKYIGGHSDLVMGALVVQDDQLKDDLFFAAQSIGGCPSVFDCYLALRGLKTLEVRMKTHVKNAYVIAQYLEKHPLVTKVIYPGLESHPQHELAQRQMRGFGGMISFIIKGGANEATTLMKNMKYATLAESLGGVESLIESPALMTHASVPPEHRQLLGIEDSLIRMSCGIENVEDLIEDIDRCLELSQK